MALLAWVENLCAAAVVALAWLAFTRFRARKPTKDVEQKSGASTPERPSLWPLSPDAALPDYDKDALTKTKPLPYRPFRYGPNYPQHMAIRNVTDSSTWLQLDQEYPATLKVRAARTANPELQSTATMPGYHAHALETLCEIASFLALRFPQLYTVTRGRYDPSDPKTYGDSTAGEENGAVTGVANLITGETYDFAAIEASEGPEWNPMRVAGCFWRLKDKLGLTLDEIHFKGAVPNYAEKYQKAMNRFFTNLREDKLVERNNYFFQVDGSLDWSNGTNGSEDVFDQYNKGPRADVPQDKVARQPTSATDISEIHFRCERQTLRRLPKSRAILFTIRTYLVPVTKLADEPGVPGRMASGVRSWPEGDRSVAWYKAAEMFAPILLPYLDEKHDEQVRSGAITLNEKGMTEEKYPF
ncbi:hypothetical protein JCM10908_001374 [Rhodotorula pacifica]|uniref:heme-dependent oxidative N-demethylase family protein n=1 Tax=Rhodotorula pacifica TaxID=1495444 RepID=UPI00316D578B